MVTLENLEKKLEQYQAANRRYLELAIANEGAATAIEQLIKELQESEEKTRDFIDRALAESESEQ